MIWPVEPHISETTTRQQAYTERYAVLYTRTALPSFDENSKSAAKLTAKLAIALPQYANT